jgi:acyl-coenzyme A synthetase/AMP-(fatty) acid ligase
MPGEFIAVSRLLATGRAPRLAVCADRGREVSWREFACQVGGIVQALAPRPEARWLIHCEHPLAFAAALLAVLHAGRRAVLAPGLQPALLDALRPAYDAILGDAAAAELDLRRIAPAALDFRPLAPRAARIDLYTSGSSGESKRVEKSLYQLETEAQVLEASWGATLGGAAVVATVPHHHIYGLLFRLFWPLAAGRCFEAALCAEPDLLMQSLRRHGEAVLVSSPAHLTRLPELIDLASLRPLVRRIFSSGGPLPAATAAQYQLALGAPPTEVYGSTESGGIAWREQDGSEAGAAWRAFAQMQIRIDADGALCLRSPYLPDDDWLTMGDAAELEPDGRFRLKGRLDRVVKIEGKRASLPELEQALREHPWVRDAAVVPLDGAKQALGAVLILREPAREAAGREALIGALREFLAARFDRVLVPRQWRFVARLPSDERGKLTAAAMRQLFHRAQDAPAS